MSPLQKLVFPNLDKLSSHLGGIFGVSVTFGWQFDDIIDNFVPLSPRELG
jgi:hypothetical protein